MIPHPSTRQLRATAGTIYVVALPLRAGQIVANVVFDVSTAGAGTVPTDIFVGLASKAGVMLGQSATLKASTIWTTASAVGSGALTAPVAIPANDMYYVVLLQVGSWGTTQMTLNRTTGPHWTGTVLSQGTAGASQTALPANGSSLTIISTNGLRYYVAAS